VFVIGLSKYTFFVGAALLIAGLTLKERLVKSSAIRNAITLIVFVSIDCFFHFCLEAILGPLGELAAKLR
jgi:hypothetical protein